MPQNRRGRCRGRRFITEIPKITQFRPYGAQIQNMIRLTYEELEALRLVDLQGMEQEEAAFQMGVSRKTFWNDLKSARRKVAMALINGWALQIEGLNYAIRGEQ